MRHNRFVSRAPVAGLIGFLAVFCASGASAWELRIQGRFDGTMDPMPGVFDPVLGGALAGVPFKFHDQPFEWVIELNGNLVHRDIPATGGGSPHTRLDTAQAAHAFLYLPGLPNHIGPYAPLDAGHVLGLRMASYGNPYSFQQIVLCAARSDDCANQSYLDLFRPDPSLGEKDNPLLYQDSQPLQGFQRIDLEYLGSYPSVPFAYGLTFDSLKDVTVSGFPGYSVSPIPEPSTWALVALGLACVTVAGRRHHRSAAALAA
jgi:hypothetical protein